MSMKRAVVYLEWIGGAEPRYLRKEAGTISVPRVGEDYADSGLQQYSPRKIVKVGPKEDGVYITLESIAAAGLSKEQFAAWQEHASGSGWHVFGSGEHEAWWLYEGPPSPAVSQ